jgi:hypothetical protein
MSNHACFRRWIRPACAFLVAATLAPAAALATEPAGAAQKTAAAKPAAAMVGGGVTQETAQAAFDSFAREWMKKMHAGSLSVRETNKATAKKSNVALRFSQYADEYTTELKRTSSTTAPFVGLLRYIEKEYACADSTDAQCSVESETAVTEIFRYERGQWIY